MANAHRGEIEAELGGQTYTLCLTLGALAELEQAYGGLDLLAIAERFETGRIAASDAIRVIGAGLRGAGHDIGNEAVAALAAEGGAAGYLDIVVRLLTATFVTAAAQP
ncbi:MAG: gene transfer agent family protein [Hyphomicrobiales bacterium]